MAEIGYTAYMFLLLVMIGASEVANLEALTKMTSQLTPAAVVANTTHIAPGDRAALAKLIDAGRLMDAVYLQQVWRRNVATLASLARDDTDIGRARLGYFLVNKGPWSIFNKMQPFLPGVPARPPGAAFYPEDASKASLDAWLKTLSPAERIEALSPVTIIRHAGQGYVSIPYSQTYQDELGAAAQLLNEAAALVAEPSLKRYLSGRAVAFADNHYAASDAAWNEVKAGIEVYVGPARADDDMLYGVKASFGMLLGVRNDKETARLSALANQFRPTLAQIATVAKDRAMPETEIADMVFASGADVRSALEITAQTHAPLNESGATVARPKTVLFKNAIDTKFSAIMKPIAEAVMAKSQIASVKLDEFFLDIVLITWADALIGDAARGPSFRELYATLSRSTYHASALYALEHLTARDGELTTSATIVAMLFRWLRFDIATPSGRSAQLILSYLVAHGAITFDDDGRVLTNPTAMPSVVETMAREFAAIFESQDYARAQALFQKYGDRPEYKKLLDRLREVPIDVDPILIN